MKMTDETEESCQQCLINNIEDVYPVYLIKRKNKPNLRYFNQCRNVQRPQHRLVLKNGRPVLYVMKRPWFGMVYVHDLVNTLINCEWKWTLVALSSAFMFTWLIFAYFWMMIAMNNGDMDIKNATTKPCLSGIQSFVGYLLFSIETQSTIGYGTRYINDHCPEAVLLLCIQIIAGICVCGLLVSIVFEKISGPRKFNSKNCFSKYATICQRDGELCLTFRVRDCDRRYQCNNQIKAYLIEKRDNEYVLKSVKLEPPGLLIWPIEIVHKINSSSPFWDLSAKDLILKRLEIIVLMEGTCLSTSNVSSTTASYLSKEILWGHTFKPCVQYDKEDNCYIVNHKLFNTTKEILMPLCSARRLAEVFQDLSNNRDTSSSSYCFSCFSTNTERSQTDKSSGSMTVSPILEHFPIDRRKNVSPETANFNRHNTSQEILLNNYHYEGEVDPLLNSLQKFLKENNSNSLTHSYCETSF